MRITVTLDDDVFEAARAQAQVSGKRLGAVLSQLARRGLRASTPGATPSGLPVFKVPADAYVILSSRAKDLLTDVNKVPGHWSRLNEPLGGVIVDPPPGERRKFYFDGGQVEIAADGKQHRVVKFTDYTAKEVRILCASATNRAPAGLMPASAPTA